MMLGTGKRMLQVGTGMLAVLLGMSSAQAQEKAIHDPAEGPQAKAQAKVPAKPAGAIARQSGGARLFAAFDIPEPALPGAPAVTGSRSASSTSGMVIDKGDSRATIACGERGSPQKAINHIRRE